MSLKHPDKVGLWAKEWMEWEFNEFIARYNVAPTDRVTIGRRNGAKAEAVTMPWGIKGADGILRTNARDDNAFKFHQKRLQDRRCVVFADGYYEWKTVGKEKHPFHFQLKGEQPFCFAGLYSNSDGFLIFTTKPNEVAAEVHNRMPVILDRDTSLRWLKEGPMTKDEFEAIAKPWPAEVMESYEVSRYVSRSGNEGPECLAKPGASVTARAGKLTAEKANGDQLNLF